MKRKNRPGCLVTDFLGLNSTMTRTKTKTTHFYRLECVHEGWYTDEDLESCVGKSSDGSGGGFGERDICWYFKHLKQATDALKRLSKKKKLSTLSLSYEKT